MTYHRSPILILPSVFLLLFMARPTPSRSQTPSASEPPPREVQSVPVSIPNTQVLGMHSTFADRDYVMHVNLPADYGKGDKQYPVVYLLDGQWDFPLVSAIYGEQYFDGFVPGFITVGITWGGTNPDYDRLRAKDFTPSSPDGSANWGNAPRFINFIRRELIPFIEGIYRTQKGERTLVGSSLGGLFTLYALYTGPDLFNRYVLTSPAFQWDNSVLETYEKEFAKKGAETPVKLYMAVGELEPGAPDFLQYANHLIGEKYHNLTIAKEVLGNTGHSGTKASGYTHGLQFVFAPETVKVSSSALLPLVGAYASGNDTLHVNKVRDNLTIARRSGPVLPLVPITETDFHVKGIFFNLHFKKDDRGRIYGVQYDGYNRQLYLKRLSPPADHAGNSFSGFPRKLRFLPGAPSSLPVYHTLSDRPADTLTGRVYHWADLDAKKDSSRDRREIIDGHTPDLKSLEVHASTLDPGKAPHPPHSHADMEELVVVKEGKLRATINGKTTLLGPGSVALALPGDMHGFENAANTRTTYYVIKFQSATPIDIPRGRNSGGSITVNWDTLTVQPTGKGEKRQLFDRATALFSKLDLHATTLNAGEVSHAPHVHRQEEVLLLRRGNVTMQIGDKFYPAAAGDLIFLPSGVLHALKNTGTAPCQYFALQWSE